MNGMPILLLLHLIRVNNHIILVCFAGIQTMKHFSTSLLGAAILILGITACAANIQVTLLICWMNVEVLESWSYTVRTRAIHARH